MKNESQLRLYLVSNPLPFTRYEDHEAALQLQIHELIERAILQKENPVALMEEYLQVSYNGGDTVEDMANFLINNDRMIYAHHNLKENWEAMDETLPEVSLKHAGTSREAVQLFLEITLRNYLEALAGIYEG